MGEASSSVHGDNTADSSSMGFWVAVEQPATVALGNTAAAAVVVVLMVEQTTIG